jgi:hypothetical protein
MKLKRFPQGDEITPRIGKGQFASVYAVSDTHAAKVYDWPYFPGSYLRDMQEEYQNTLRAYEAGISVPKPEGVFKVKIRWFKTLFGYFFPGRTALVMEWIKGERADKTDGNLHKRVRELFDKEVEKCMRLGFFSGDFYLNNAIYAPERDKLYLIDLADCGRE